MRISRQIFNYILTEICEYIEKTLTNLNLAPISTHVQLPLIFGVSEPFAGQVFNHVCQILVATWGFIKNYEFPCVRAWDEFHSYTTTKSNITVLKSYSISNMGLVS